MHRPDFVRYCKKLLGNNSTLVEPVSASVFQYQHRPTIWMEILWRIVVLPEYNVDEAGRGSVFALIAHPSCLGEVMTIMGDCQNGKMFGNRVLYLIGVTYILEILDHLLCNDQAKSQLNLHTQKQIASLSVQVLSLFLPQNRERLEEFTHAIELAAAIGNNAAMANETSVVLRQVQNGAALVLDQVTAIHFDGCYCCCIKRPKAASFLSDLADFPVDNQGGIFAAKIVEICRVCYEETFERGGVEAMLAVFQCVNWFLSTRDEWSLPCFKSPLASNTKELMFFFESYQVQEQHPELSQYVMLALFYSTNPDLDSDDFTGDDYACTKLINRFVLQRMLDFAEKHPDNEEYISTCESLLKVLQCTASCKKTGHALRNADEEVRQKLAMNRDGPLFQAITDILDTAQVDPEGYATFCEYCNKEKKVTPCAGCRRVNYCSTECYKNDWKKHKVWCDHANE
jgi:hypothetical protein